MSTQMLLANAHAPTIARVEYMWDYVRVLPKKGIMRRYSNLSGMAAQASLAGTQPLTRVEGLKHVSNLSHMV